MGKEKSKVSLISRQASEPTGVNVDALSIRTQEQLLLDEIPVTIIKKLIVP